MAAEGAAAAPPEGEAEAEGEAMLEPKIITLSKELVKEGLSLVHTDHHGTFFSKFKLKGYNIGKIDEALSTYTQLKYIDLSNNFIISLKPLRALPDLLSIDVRFNILTDMRGFEDLRYLQLAQLDNNELKDLKSFDHPHLKALTLCRNRIKNFQGLKPNMVPALRILDISHNLIDNMIGSANFANLEILKIRGNKLVNFDGIQKLRCLKQLDARDNLIPSVKEVEKLVTLPALRVLMASGNEGMYEKDPLIEVVMHLRKLGVFDGTTITDVEREAAEVLEKERVAEAAAAAAEAAALAAEELENEGDDDF